MSQKYGILAIGLIGFISFTLSTIASEPSVRRIHPVSVVEADVYVNRFKTTMRLKCFAEDLELLQGVEALADGFYDPEELKDATKDHAKYLAKRVQLIDATGKQLEAKITGIVDFEIPEEGIRQGTLMSYQMEFELEFSYEEPPEFLTINQQMIADGALLPSELKVLVKQAGSDTAFPFVMMKPDKPETYRFDWDNPVLSAEASEKEWDSWFDEQREKTLGITSYSSVYSFIYITHHEVRHEVLIPLATLATLIDIEREDTSYLSIEEQGPAAELIQDYFSIGNPVVIDSVEVKPTFDRIDFYGLDLRDFAVQADKRPVSMANGRVGVIMSYSTKGTPREVKVTWDKFNDAVRTVDSVIFAFEKVLKTEFTMFLTNNTYVWAEPDRPALPPITGVSAAMDLESHFIRPTIAIPTVSICIGFFAVICLLAGVFVASIRKGGLALGATLLVLSLATLPIAKFPVESPFGETTFEMPEREAKDVFAQLHKNIFRAFDYVQASDVYDSLEISVDGEFLRKLYRNINESLKVKEQGGAVARIDNVQIVNGELFDQREDGVVQKEPGFAYRCQWDLVGTVEHWGHIHQRTNQYNALFNVKLVDDAWKITDMVVLNESQGPVKTSLRKF